MLSNFTEKESELLGGDDSHNELAVGDNTPAPAILVSGTAGASRTVTPNENAMVMAEMAPENTIDEIAKKEDILEGNFVNSIP